MTHWPIKPLGELSKSVMGQAPPGSASNFEGKGTPFVKAGEFGKYRPIIREWTTKPLKFAKFSDVLVCVVGATCGKLNLGEDCAIGRSVAAIRPNPSLLNQRYLYSFLQGWTLRLRSGSQGSAQGVITRDMLESIPIPMPPLAEQERIVKLLEEADEMRNLRAQADRRTAELIPALFHEMFGDPVPGGNRWPVHALGELIITGPQNGLYRHSSFYGRGTPILRIDAFYDGEIEDLNKLKRLQITPEEITRYNLRKNDIVINRVNSPDYLGKSVLIPALPEPTVFESNMMRFAISREQLDPHYLICFLQTSLVKRHILGRAKHSINQSSINQEDVGSIPVPLPPLSLQRDFAKWLMKIRELEAEQSASRSRVEDLYQSMLHRAFSGEL
jgi:type I restriction enzyme S subunit